MVEKDPFFVGVAVSRADFPKPYKGETLKTFARVTSSCLFVGVKELRTFFRSRVIHFIFIKINLVRAFLYKHMIRSRRGRYKLLRNRPFLNVDQIFVRAKPTGHHLERRGMNRG